MTFVNEKRRYQRYSIHGAAGFRAGEDFYSGNILNASMNGILVELVDDKQGNISTGQKTTIRVCDLFSNGKFSFDSEVIRQYDRWVAFRFLNPHTDYEAFFLKHWFYIVENPSRCI